MEKKRNAASRPCFFLHIFDGKIAGKNLAFIFLSVNVYMQQFDYLHGLFSTTNLILKEL